MKLHKLLLPLFALIAITALSACDDNKSYAEMLTDENHAVNYYLANQRVINEIPADSVFEYGPDAPFYRLNEDATLYMQVIDPGNPDNKAEYNQLIYYRFTRYNLRLYMSTNQLTGEGNSDNLLNGSTSFRFQNRNTSAASNYGLGIQEPLKYLGINCHVRIIVKSQLGPSSEIATVIPYLYDIRYFESPL